MPCRLGGGWCVMPPCRWQEEDKGVFQSTVRKEKGLLDVRPWRAWEKGKDYCPNCPEGENSAAALTGGTRLPSLDLFLG